MSSLVITSAILGLNVPDCDCSGGCKLACGADNGAECDSDEGETHSGILEASFPALSDCRAR